MVTPSCGGLNHPIGCFREGASSMNADGSNQRALTDEDGVIDRHPSWQPVKS